MAGWMLVAFILTWNGERMEIIDTYKTKEQCQMYLVWHRAYMSFKDQESRTKCVPFRVS